MTITKKVVDKVDESLRVDIDNDSTTKVIAKSVTKGVVEVLVDWIAIYGVVTLGMVIYANITGKKIGFLDKK